MSREDISAADPPPAADEAAPAAPSSELGEEEASPADDGAAPEDADAEASAPPDDGGEPDEGEREPPEPPLETSEMPVPGFAYDFASKAAAARKMRLSRRTSCLPGPAPDLEAEDRPRQRRRRRRASLALGESPPASTFLDDLRAFYKADQGASRELFTNKALLQRESLRFAPRVVLWSILFWRAIDLNKSNTIERWEFLPYAMSIYRVLHNTWDEARARRVCNNDWESDRRDRPHINCESFFLSLFQIADTWTEGISEDEMAEFLEILFHCIMKWDETNRRYSLRPLDKLRPGAVQSVLAARRRLEHAQFQLQSGSRVRSKSFFRAPSDASASEGEGPSPRPSLRSKSFRHAPAEQTSKIGPIDEEGPSEPRRATSLRRPPAGGLASLAGAAAHSDGEELKDKKRGSISLRNASFKRPAAAASPGALSEGEELHRPRIESARGLSRASFRRPAAGGADREGRSATDDEEGKARAALASASASGSFKKGPGDESEAEENRGPARDVVSVARATLGDARHAFPASSDLDHWPLYWSIVVAGGWAGRRGRGPLPAGGRRGMLPSSTSFKQPISDETYQRLCIGPARPLSEDPPAAPVPLAPLDLDAAPLPRPPAFPPSPSLRPRRGTLGRSSSIRRPPQSDAEAADVESELEGAGLLPTPPPRRGLPDVSGTPVSPRTFTPRSGSIRHPSEHGEGRPATAGPAPWRSTPPSLAMDPSRAPPSPTLAARTPPSDRELPRPPQSPQTPGEHSPSPRLARRSLQLVPSAKYESPEPDTGGFGGIAAGMFEEQWRAGGGSGGSPRRSSALAQPTQPKQEAARSGSGRRSLQMPPPAPAPAVASEADLPPRTGKGARSEIEAALAAARELYGRGEVDVSDSEAEIDSAEVGGYGNSGHRRSILRSSRRGSSQTGHRRSVSFVETDSDPRNRRRSISEALAMLAAECEASAAQASASHADEPELPAPPPLPPLSMALPPFTIAAPELTPLPRPPELPVLPPLPLPGPPVAPPKATQAPVPSARPKPLPSFLSVLVTNPTIPTPPSQPRSGSRTPRAASREQPAHPPAHPPRAPLAPLLGALAVPSGGISVNPAVVSFSASWHPRRSGPWQ